MKALAFVLILLVMGDLAFDHGAGVCIVGHAASTFAHDFERDFAESLFAA